MAYDFNGLRLLARAAGLEGSDIDVAAAVAMAESGGNPGEISSTGDYGLWQINARSWPQFNAQRLLDPAYNAAAMEVIRRTGRGWDHWRTYRNGNYRQYLELNPEDIPRSSAGLPVIIPGADPGGAVGAQAGAAGDALDLATAWVEPLIAGAGKLMLGLVLGAAGLALVGLGLARLTDTETAKKAVGAAGAAGAIAAGGPMGAAMTLAT